MLFLLFKFGVEFTYIIKGQGDVNPPTLFLFSSLFIFAALVNIFVSFFEMKTKWIEFDS
jgi:hypothetical protein